MTKSDLGWDEFTVATALTFKTDPLEHQATEWMISKDREVRGILWEQGTGKTKLILDTAAHLWRAQKADGLLVLAPNGVQVNWATDEIPAHMPEDVPIKVHVYQSKRALTKWHKQACEEVLAYRGFPIVTMSYDAFMTKKGRQFAEKFLHERNTFYVLDESQRIKSPKAKRTISVVASGRRATYKRILSGTPITNSPFDIYSQMKFLDERFWKDRGFGDFFAFKTFFGVWVTRVANEGRSNERRFPDLVEYKNLEILSDTVAEHTTRVLKEDVLDLPPKLYTKRYFDLSSQQRKIYEDLIRDFMTFLDSGELITAPLVITRLLRLQQLTCGYVVDDKHKLQRLPENPRLKLLLDTLTDVDGSAIIWARFREDINQICAELGAHAVRFDGKVNDRERQIARNRFQDGDVRFFVGNPAAAGVGLTLHRAKTVIYYSNSFNFEHRLQSEDRAHRIGQTNSVLYIDLCGINTVDSHIIDSLREKRTLASTITKDKLREWL